MPDLAGYAFVGFVAALVTTLATPVVAWVARRQGWVVEPDDRRVHEQSTPAVGGLAMYLGFLVAMLVAWQLDRFTVIFEDNSEPLGVVLAATLIFAVGLLDDLHPISAPAKVAGIAVAGLVLAVTGVTMVYFRIPFYGVIDIGFDWIPLVTILWLLGMTNAINLIDGLDGLAAGIVAIAAGTFFLYSQRLDELGRLATPSIGPLLTRPRGSAARRTSSSPRSPSRSSSSACRSSTRSSPSCAAHAAALGWRPRTRTTCTTV
jgi:UDP-GlcNAc:undecaprenyl-phosphate/decaprenyl-phosphate GlcNAc-1-phosphate transferase